MARAALALLLVLALATAASAECAWVLWDAPNPPLDLQTPITVWLPLSAHESQKACYQAMDLVGGYAKGSPFMLCLPDTVDPRGPKGARP